MVEKVMNMYRELVNVDYNFVCKSHEYVLVFKKDKAKKTINQLNWQF